MQNTTWLADNQLFPQADQPNITTTHNDALINWVHKHLCYALEYGASDIHLEPQKGYHRLRYRIDGQLIEQDTIAYKEGQQALARLKIMAQLDTAEYRLPQDGRFTATYQNESFHFRLSTCPTTQGEKAVVRLLNHRHFKHIDQLDMTCQQNQLLKQALSAQQGLVLVCGPTGSGKTTTLYAGLDYLNQGCHNIVTAEDPAEIDLPGVNQVNINHHLGLRFDELLRRFLRQDPDIIMVGEIRDYETAAMAIKAAQTGHLVLATLHSNTTQKALTRLRHLGIAEYDVHEACQLIVAQRLLPSLCQYCCLSQSPPSRLTKYLAQDRMSTIYKPQGCQLCYEGYRGRIAIHELMTVDDDKALVTDSLIQDGIRAMQSGQISYKTWQQYIEQLDKDA